MTLVPLKCGDYCSDLQRRVNLNSIVWTIAPIYNGGISSMTLHEFVIIMTLLIGTSGTMKYNIRYI